MGPADPNQAVGRGRSGHAQDSFKARREGADRNAGASGASATVTTNWTQQHRGTGRGCEGPGITHEQGAQTAGCKTKRHLVGTNTIGMKPRTVVEEDSWQLRLLPVSFTNTAREYDTVNS
jgi:hypothetical protein